MDNRMQWRWAIVGLLAAGASARAQELGVSYLAAKTDLELMHRLDGVGVEWMSPRRRRVAARIAYHHLAGTNNAHEGQTCLHNGPFEPCPVEPLGDRVTLDQLVVAADVRGFQRSSLGAVVEVAGRVGIQLARAKDVLRGRTTGRVMRDVLPASMPLGGVNAAVGVTVRSRPSSPIGLQLGLGSGLYAGRSANSALEYRPFVGGFNITRAEIGLVWSLVKEPE